MTILLMNLQRYIIIKGPQEKLQGVLDIVADQFDQLQPR